uniref:CHCH domain-containing protein n=1 Tax=Steinernema glaseri TaxID=37863 RepID=A0A1I7ZVA7_9BILA
MSPGKSEWAKDDVEEDRVEKLIRSSGCWDNHLSVVDCMSEQKDWRKCQEVLSSFRDCMTKNRKELTSALAKEVKEVPKQQSDEKKN